MGSDKISDYKHIQQPVNNSVDKQWDSVNLQSRFFFIFECENTVMV